MAIRFGDIKRSTRDVIIGFGDETITVSYRLGAITPTLGQEFNESGDVNTIGLLERVIDHWDILDDDTGKPVPATPEVLNSLPVTLLQAMVQAINADLVTDSKKP